MCHVTTSDLNGTLYQGGAKRGVFVAGAGGRAGGPADGAAPRGGAGRRRAGRAGGVLVAAAAPEEVLR